MDLNLEAFDGVLTEPPMERGETDSGSQDAPSEKKLLAVTLHHNDDDDSDESRVPPPVGPKSEPRSGAAEEGPALPVTSIACNAVARLDATLQEVFEDICITFYSASRLPTPEGGNGAFVDECLEKRLAGLRFLDPVVEQDFIVFWNRPARATRLVLSYLLVVFCVFSPDHDATTTAVRRAAAGLITVLFALAASHYYYQRRQLKSEADALDRIATTRDDASLLRLRLQFAEVLRTRERLEGVAILVALMVVQITAPLLNHEDCINPEVVCPRGLHPRQVCVLVACATGTMRCVVKIPLILLGGVTFGIASLLHDPTSAQPPSTWSLVVFMGMVCCVLIAFSFASECSGRVHFDRDFRRQVKGRMTVARHRHFDSLARCAMPRLLRSRAAEAMAGPDGSTVPVTEAACAVVLCEMPQLLTWMSFLPQSSIGQATHAIQTALDVEANAFGVDKVSTTFGCLVYAASGSAKSAAEAFADRAPSVARAALAAAIDDRYYSELSDIAVDKFCMVTSVGLGSAVFSVVGSGVLVPYLTGSALANAMLALADARLHPAPLPPLTSSHNVLRRQQHQHPHSKSVAPLAQQWQRTFLESGSHDTALFDVLQQTTYAAVNVSLNEDATLPKTTTAAGLSSSGGPVTTATSSRSALSASSVAEGGKGVFLYRQGHCSEVTAAKRKQKWNSMYADEVVQREYVEFAAAEDALTGRYSLAGQLAFYASLIAVALVETTSSGSVSESITDVGPPLYAAVLLGCCILLISTCLGIVIQRREVLPQAVEAGICFSCAALCCSFPLVSHRISWLNSSESLAACLAPLLFTAMKRIPTAYMVLLFLGGLVLPVLACNTNIAVNPEDAFLPAVLVAVLGFAVLRGNCAGPALASLFETMLDIRTLIAVLEQQSAAHLDLLQNMFPEPIAESIQQSIAATAKDVTDPDPEVAAAATMPPLWVAHPGRDPSCVSDTESLAEHWCGTGPLDQRRYIAPNTIIVELNVRREDPLEGTAESQRFSFMHSRQDPSSSLGRAYGDTHGVLQAIVLHFERYNCDGHLQVVNVTGDRVQVAGPFLALGMSRKACSELPIAVAHAATRALLKLDTVLEPYKACATGVCVAAGAATTLIGALPRTFMIMGAAPEESSRLLSAVPEIGTCAFWATERFVNTFSQAAFLAANEQERLTVLVPHWARSGGAWVKPAFARWKVRGSPITNMRLLRSSPEEEV